MLSRRQGREEHDAKGNARSKRRTSSRGSTEVPHGMHIGWGSRCRVHASESLSPAKANYRDDVVVAQESKLRNQEQEGAFHTSVRTRLDMLRISLLKS